MTLASMNICCKFYWSHWTNYSVNSVVKTEWSMTLNHGLWPWKLLSLFSTGVI